MICPENYIMNGECDWAIQNLESCNFDREDCVESKECLELVYFLKELDHYEMCDKVQFHIYAKTVQKQYNFNFPFWQAKELENTYPQCDLNATIFCTKKC